MAASMPFPELDRELETLDTELPGFSDDDLREAAEALGRGTLPEL
jgi:hypothetical protein